MSMSTHVIGFVPPDDDWRRHKAVWDACDAAGVAMPQETRDFFQDEPPDEAGVEVCLKGAIRPWNDKSRSGFEVIVEKLPPHVKIIRFYNSF